MAIIKNVKWAVKQVDLFFTTELIRYKQDPQFKTFSGGLCSIILIIGFAIIFANTAITTLSKEEITAVSTVSEDPEPQFFKTDDNSFLFAVGISGIDMNDPDKRWFDISFSQRTQFINRTKIKDFQTLVACDRDVWVKKDPKLGVLFDRIGFSTWLCSPPGFMAQFQGKYTSDVFKYIKISVDPCNNASAFDSRTCASDTEVDEFIADRGAFLFNYYYLNTIINAQNSVYLDSYLEDKNYFQFTRTLGMTANIFTSGYEINTDQSLLPVEEIKTDIGGIVHEETQTFILEPVDAYVELFLRKSSLSVKITRQFLSYDDTLSYIGGLFTTFIALLYTFHKYNEYTYEIEIGSRMFKYNQQQALKPTFNVLEFFMYAIYKLLQLFKKEPSSWTQTHQFTKNKEETGNQLDLIMILKKINFLENCMNYLFTEYQLNALHLQNKITLKQAQEMRMRHWFYLNFMKKVKKHKGDLLELQNENNQDENVKVMNVNEEVVLGKNSQFSSVQLENVKAEDWKGDKILSSSHNIEELEEKKLKKLDIFKDIPSDEQEQGNEEEELKFVKQIYESIEELEKNSEVSSKSLKIFNELDIRIKKIYRKMKKIKKKFDSPFGKVSIEERNHDFYFLDDDIDEKKKEESKQHFT